MNNLIFINIQKNDVFIISNNEKIEFIKEYINNISVQIPTGSVNVDHGFIFKNEKGDNYLYNDYFIPIGKKTNLTIFMSSSFVNIFSEWHKLSEKEEKDYKIVGKIPNYKDKLNQL